jgi:hypothetical protein
MDLAFKEMIRDQDEDFLKESPERPRSVSYFKAYQPTRQKTNPMAVWDAIHRQSQERVEKLKKNGISIMIPGLYFFSWARRSSIYECASVGRFFTILGL